MEPILNISNLNLSFVSKQNKDDSLYLFRDLKLEVPDEKITALVGGNGAGKTTLFNVISGIQKGAGGNIFFNNKSIKGLAPYQVSRLGIGRLFQGAKVFDELSILDNMLLGSLHAYDEQPFSKIVFKRKTLQVEKALNDKAEMILSDLFGKDNLFWDKRFSAAGNLSFGQQRLLALAQLLMGNYRLYLLDEPTAGVNVSFISQIAAVIRQMNSKNHKTVLMIEHNMQFVRYIAEYCLFMANGRIIVDGTPAEVLDNEIVQQSYMGF